VVEDLAHDRRVEQEHGEGGKEPRLKDVTPRG